MSYPVLKIDHPVAETDDQETSAEPEGTRVAESLFENFVDEIDVWARRALAANGFGDYL